jgi:thiosulfate/3-mercaptopyruvate sulfurtransferase
MASGVIGQPKANEIIVYCGVGGYASSWWFVLTQVLEYDKVRIFDGSIQEWSKDPKAPMTKYSWR